MTSARGQSTSHRWLIVVASICVVLNAGPAAAQGFVTAGVGAAFGGDVPSSKATYNVAAGATAAGLLGLEVEFGHTPTFFEAALDSGNVITVMADVLIGAPFGPLRPYAVGGLGLIRQRATISVGGLFNNISDNDFGFNVGGGVIVKVAPYVGLRSEVRHFHVRRTGGFSFNRATVGVVLGR